MKNSEVIQLMETVPIYFAVNYDRKNRKMLDAWKKNVLVAKHLTKDGNSNNS